jgi:hypothetical protein
MYEVSTRICARLTREVHWIGTTVSNLPTFDGLNPLETFLLDFEASVPTQQRPLAMDEALKATLARWWGTHKSNIIVWVQCRTFMIAQFSAQVKSYEVRYTGRRCPKDHVRSCEEAWSDIPREQWVHRFINTLDMTPINWYLQGELCLVTADWEGMIQNFITTFLFESQYPSVDQTLQIVRQKVFEEESSLPLEQEEDEWIVPLQKLQGYYNINADDDDDPRKVNITETEGQRDVKGLGVELPFIGQPIMITKVNIGTEETLKLANVGDCWDAATIDKGIKGPMGEMRISLKPDTKPVKQRPYRLNPKYKEKVKIELDRMLEPGIIELVEELEWINPMVVQDKKTGEIKICVDLRKLNDACLHDNFPTPFTDEVLDNVGGQEVYSFTDGFSGYHQIRIAKEDRHKTTFATEWGSYQYTVMLFGLKTAPTIFSRVVVETFKEFLHKFLEAYFDDWTVFSLLKNHIECLRLMLDKCRQCQIALNLKKCIFFSPFGVLLGHILCKQGLLVDPSKIAIIVDLPPPTLVKQLRTTLGHTGYYRKFIKGYTQITTPMEKLLKKDCQFSWTEECQQSFDTLKQKMVTAPILVFPDWTKKFHVHVDASSIALGVVLAQSGK